MKREKERAIMGSNDLEGKRKRRGERGERCTDK